MGNSGKLFLLATFWCSVFLPRSVDSQTYLYKQKDVNHYEIKNGKYRIITTTTPPPTLMETFFPWTGSAYNSVRTPEEDAAILNSLSDPEPPSSNSGPPPPSSSGNDGFMSWLGFMSPNDAPASQSNYPPLNYGPYGYHHPPPPPPMNYLPPMNMIGAASQLEPVVVPPPGAENQLGLAFGPPPGSELNMLGAPPLPLQQQVPPPPPQFSPGIDSYDVPQEIRNNVNPTFQFHQQVKDSIPIPSPSLPGFGPSMFPYPGGSLDFIKSTTEKPSSFLDVISNYFTFGKRSDLDGEEFGNPGENVIQARSMSGEDEQYDTEEVEKDENGEQEPEMKEGAPAAADPPSPPPAPSTDGKAFPCPKSGIWRWNGEVCIAVGPVPIWACRPNDLMVSGKIAICRNKIYFSPKVITNAIN